MEMHLHWSKTIYDYPSSACFILSERTIPIFATRRFLIYEKKYRGPSKDTRDYPDYRY